MRRLLAATLASLLLAASAAAKDCVPPGDPFAPSSKMPAGRYVGLCLDPGKRSYRPISAELTAGLVPASVIGAHPGARIVANVHHAGEFWIAVIPADAVESLVFQVERFPPRWLLAHSMLRVNYAKPVMLFHQTDPKREAVAVSQLILSVEGVKLVNGPGYGPVSAMGEYFALSKRLLTQTQKIDQVVLDEGNTVRQYAVKLDAKRSGQLWSHLLDKLADPDMTQMYNLRDKNCMNETFNEIDAFLGRVQGRWDRVSISLPNFTRAALDRRGLYDRAAALPTLNEEMAAIYSLPLREACPYLFKPDADGIVALPTP